MSVPAALDSAGCSCGCRVPSSHRRCCDCTASSAPTTNVQTRLGLISSCCKLYFQMLFVVVVVVVAAAAVVIAAIITRTVLVLS